MTEKKSKNNIAVKVESISKAYGSVIALNDVSLEIESGRYFVLLGPSGGGKTTLLRLIGGFIQSNKGKIYLNQIDVSQTPPNKRPTSMVFQGFALFPHMNVEKNVSYGLRLKKLNSSIIKEKVGSILDLVGLKGLESRMPHELSGGQQQRAQLARSLVLEPDILLLDEPLAALDAKLHKNMCIELKRLQEKVNITFIHVTHNQEEAMTIADDLAIIAGGELVEIGETVDLYKNPIKRFTADFLGQNNIFDGVISEVIESHVIVDLGFKKIKVKNRDFEVNKDDKVSVSIRSECIKLNVKELNIKNFQTLEGKYIELVYLGLTTSNIVALPNGQEIIIRQISEEEFETTIAKGQNVLIGWQIDDAKLHVN